MQTLLDRGLDMIHYLEHHDDQRKLDERERRFRAHEAELHEANATRIGLKGMSLPLLLIDVMVSPPYLNMGAECAN